MSFTTDPNDPRLTRHVNDKPVGQAEIYLVMSEEERAKGYVRPVRTTYVHAGDRVTTGKVRPLTEEEKERYKEFDYAAFEEYPPERFPVTGRFLKKEELRALEAGLSRYNGCNGATTMAMPLAETYARDPKFYGSTYCCHCKKHRPVSEFYWADDGEEVGS